jgi:hypothetical protein
MTRYMYDSIYANQIPLDAPVVAGYVDGRYKWSDADWARFPNAVKVRIAVFATTNDGHVLDVERGDATAQESAYWTQMRRASGLLTPAIYCGDGVDGYKRSEVLAAHAALGIAAPLIWLASWTWGTPVLPWNCIALQYASYLMLNTGYDLSLCADHWPGVDPEPEPGPGPVPGPLPTDPCEEYLQNALSAISRIERAQSELDEAIADITYT